jgi:hypothetical protein
VGLLAIQEVPEPLVFRRAWTAFPRIGTRGDIQQVLVGLGILNHRSRLAVHGKHDRPLALLDLLHEIARPPSKGGQALNVLGDVQHRLLR